MKEGWFGDDYLVVFVDDEAADAAERYETSRYVNGFQIIGLIGWDDFILRDSAGGIFRGPTIPLDPKSFSPLSLPWDQLNLRSDERFTGKVKWYTKPLVFGGDARAGGNLVWVDHPTHSHLIKWWNAKYRSIRERS
jgi:hypothetical protein